MCGAPPKRDGAKAQPIGRHVCRRRCRSEGSSNGSQLDHQGGAGKLLDEADLRVDATQKVRIYDPGNTVRGALTMALTWGIFGLVTSGVSAVGVSAIPGAICGGPRVRWMSAPAAPGMAAEST